MAPITTHNWLLWKEQVYTPKSSLNSIYKLTSGKKKNAWGLRFYKIQLQLVTSESSIVIDILSLTVTNTALTRICLQHRRPGSIPGSGRSTEEGIIYPLQYSWASLVAQLVKNLPVMWETWVWSLGWEDPMEKEKVTHSNILAWRILYSSWGSKESDTTERLPLTTILSETSSKYFISCYLYYSNLLQW